LIYFVILLNLICQKPPVKDWWHAAYRKCDGWFLIISKIQGIFDDHQESMIPETLKIPLNLVCDGKPLVK